MGLGIFRCDKCGTSYTKKEVEKLKEKNKKRICGCGGEAKSVEPFKVHKLVHADFQAGVERFYYATLDLLSKNSYTPFKTKDVYASSEASDFWSDIERRKQFQAEQVSKYLATIGGMLKNLFQILRELRVMDERLAHYEGRLKGQQEDDIALKGIWIDKVEGGAQKPSSIYGMATQRGFTTLPDYFFRIFPKTKSDVEKEIKKTDVNEKVKEILSRKLAEYMTWVDNTHQELKMGKQFKLMYLRQHFHTIRMYLEWVKPYIHQVERFNQMNAMGAPGTDAWTEIIRAAEGAVIDLELFGIKEKTEKDYYKPCLKVSFHYSTIPEMMFHKEYQKGAIHVGQSFINFEGYMLTNNDIKKYKDHLAESDIEVLKYMDASIAAMESDLEYYLKQAQDSYYVDLKGNVKEEKQEEKKKPKFWGSLGDVLKWTRAGDKNKIPKPFEIAKLKIAVEKTLKEDTFEIFDKVKKTFEMIRW